MDASGLSAFSALPLCPLMFLLWYLEKHSRQAMGFVWGRPRDYGLALLYPVLVLSAIAIISAAAGALDLSKIHWVDTWRNVALFAVSTVLVALTTEEGFFRGWLIASLQRAGIERNASLLWSSLAFALWHLSAVTLNTGFDLPRGQIPLFMVNAAVLGLIWALLRTISGSIVVSSVSHGLWNGGAYVFFGYGTKVGALGITDTTIYGPEVGFLGLGLNLLFAAMLWRYARTAIRNPESVKSGRFSQL
jgi:membrane protease YdiL (CAAX protease family)